MDDYEYGEGAEGSEAPPPRESRKYLAWIKEAEKAFASYQSRCDSIDKKYASLKDLAEASGDREFQIFWANLEVLKPTVYSRAPVPVVSPRHRDTKELHRTASELLERVLVVDAEMDDLHETLVQVRDDLAIGARGVPWVLDTGECIHVNRRDFVHEPARKWKEVGWVARRAYMTMKEGKARFGEIFSKAKCERMKGREDGDDDYEGEKKAQVWEKWCKAEGIVVWVTEGVDTVLDEQPPMIDVKGFYPCPRPAYGTLERDTLKPVPDYVYYRDQVDEINELTARISSLSESLRLKGFYASGVSEIGEAIESAIRATDNKAVLVPVSNLAALGGVSLKDSIIWLPVREVAEVIAALVELRKQMIADVYEITGLSDIMRGSTEASETATAQNLKAQYGSVRVRERQAEMVRIARDVLRIKAEIYAETMPADQLALMAQMDIPTQQAVMQQGQQAQMQGQQIDTSKIVTLEAVDQLLKSQKLRPFVLEVESDSTIAPDEEAEKASRMEFITAVGGFIQQASAMVAAQPQTAPFAAEMLKFTAGAFRAGRELSGAIDQFAEQLKAVAAQPQEPPPDPAMMKVQADSQAMQAKFQMDMQKMEAELSMAQQKSGLEMRKLDAEIRKIEADIMRITAQAGAPKPQVAA